MFKIPAEALYRVAHYRSNAAAMEALECVWVGPGEMVAMNGHDLMHYLGDDVECDTEYCIEINKDLFKHLNHKDADYVSLDGERLVVMNKKLGETYIQPGKAIKEYLYPNWRNITDKDHADNHVELNQIAISARAMILAEKAFGKGTNVDFTFTGEADPIFYDVYNPGKLYGYRGIVMPIYMGIRDHK